MSTTNILDLNNRIDELADSYPASKVMLSDDVTSVKDALDGLEIKYAEKSGTTDSAGLLTVDNIPTNSIMLQIRAVSTGVHCFGTRQADIGTNCRIGIHLQTTGASLNSAAVTVYVYYIEVAS